MNTGNKYKYVLFILLQSLIYGVGNPLTKIAYRSITPYWLLAGRYVFAAPIIVFLARKSLIKDIKSTDVKIWLPPCVCCAAAYITGNLALNYTTATNVGFIMSLPVLIAPVLAIPVMHQKYQWKHLPVQLAAVIGLFLLCCNGGFFKFGIGEVLAFIFAACLAGHLVFGERALQDMGVMSATAIQLLFATAACFICAFAADDISVLPGVSMEAWLIVAYLGVVCSIGGFLLQNKAVPNLSSRTVALLQCSQPILTAAASYFILGESLTLIGMLGAVIIIACLVVDSRIS